MTVQIFIMQIRPVFLLCLLSLHLLSGCGGITADNITDTKQKEWEQSILRSLLAGYDSSAEYAELTISYPYQGALFPPDIAAPTIQWQPKTDLLSSHRIILVTFADGQRLSYIIEGGSSWEPDQKSWENIKQAAGQRSFKITVLDVQPPPVNAILSKGEITIGMAPVGVEAPILYRQVPLPFSVKNFDKMKWRLGDISSYHSPPVVMEGLPMCSSCHVGSRDGRYLSMEMNFKNDAGAQFIAKVQKNIVLNESNFFTWDDYPRKGILPKTRGLFGRMSPSGSYAMATVNEISLALLTNSSEFSQVFFPTYGILAYYSVAEKTFSPLPGADDYDFVQTNPDWSFNEQHVVFARAPIKNEVHDDITDVSPKYKNEDIHSLNKRYNIQFDLYRVPFNNGLGGAPEPLLGASANGMSNYFPRHSPDGKWLVFTQSRTGIMLQPDSQLYIVPAQGGAARKMRSNRELFNSWHSWSPNSRWLLFSSKVNTPFTEIFLTYVDEEGNDYPPVLLSRFSDPQYAANVPEFINISPGSIETIVLKH